MTPSRRAALAAMYRERTGRTTYTPPAPPDPAKRSQYWRERNITVNRTDEQ